MDWTEARPGRRQIVSGEVHLWRFALADPERRDQSPHLTDDERSRAEAMSSPAARQSFVASQSALREVLSAYTLTPPRDIRFARATHGKPLLATTPNSVEFNVSHSGDWGLIAVAGVPVGVDVEQVDLRRATARVAQRFLTPAERELLSRRERAHGQSAFFVIWSRKEAYLKAAGFGLSAPFSRVDSAADRLPDLDERGSQLAGETPWSIHEFFVDHSHPAAVVARAPELRPTFLTLRRPDR